LVKPRDTGLTNHFQLVLINPGLYRCTYGHEEAWQRFTNILKQNVEARSRTTKVPEVLLTLRWKVFEGPEFKNASKDAVRDPFTAWTSLAEAGAEEPHIT